MPDRASLNLYVRLAASASLALFLLHGGMHLDRDGFGPLALGVTVFLLFAFTVGALWATSRLNVKRGAAWTCLALLGVLPAAFVPFHPVDSYAGAYGVTLVGIAVAALATLGLTGLLLASRDT
ncbi:MAG TPA: hypothetical protein VNZ52_00025 [Candidatus Thermoplasmatota archaeon]|nr:hypothetical protein [Candidatus Thermoplasmatota archaeon]